LDSVLASLATPHWQLVTGTADGFGLTGIPFEALDNGEKRITLWSVDGETWISAELRPGWDATRQVTGDTDLRALIAALLAGDLERSPIPAPTPSLFAGLFGRSSAEPVGGSRLSVAGVELEEWPVSQRGGVFSNVSPRRGTTS
jgi:hypothetical protein